MLYQNLYTRLSKLTLIAVILLGGLDSLTAAAQQPEANIRAMLEQRDRDLKKLLGPSGDVPDAKKDQLRNLVNGLIDFDSMGEASLGNYWETITPTQRTEFVRVFSEIVREQSLADIDIYRAIVIYDAIVADKLTALVTTTTTYKDVPAKVEYVLLLKGTTWLAKDIVIDKVSTVEGYSRSFQSVIRKKGFDALMTSLNKRLAKIK
jgi:phospholipid transport system substrate-binding protein